MMRFSTVLVAALTTVTATGFLLPLNPIHYRIAEEALRDARYREANPLRDSFTAWIASQPIPVDLDCPDCPFAFRVTEELVEDGAITKGLGWVGGIENTIHLELSTDERGLLVNGRAVWPHDEDTAVPTIMATQNRKDNGVKSVEFPINVVFEAQPVVKAAPTHEEGMEINSVEVTILGLNGIPVKVDTVKVDLLTTIQDGQYTIVQTTKIPFSQTPGAQACEGVRSWSLCRVKAIFLAHLDAVIEKARSQAHRMQDWVMKPKPGCGRGRGRKGEKGRPRNPLGGAPFKHRPHGPPGFDTDNIPNPPHHHHRHHPYSHRIGHMFHKAVRFVVIPALLGIAGGLMASAVGMLVGQAIVYLWFRTYRRSQRGSARSTADVSKPASIQDNTTYGNEKEALLIVQEQPPQYEDAAASTIDVEAVAASKEDEGH